MYACNLCDKEYPYLIFEYNALVCEKCSIHKNIKNVHEIPTADLGDEVEEVVEVEENDVQELFGIIELIKNPKIREDFLDIVYDYLGEADSQDF
jgi:DNA-directed RNA polymerase subunit RPC12/RpoP